MPIVISTRDSPVSPFVLVATINQSHFSSWSCQPNLAQHLPGSKRLSGHLHSPGLYQWWKCGQNDSFHSQVNLQHCYHVGNQSVFQIANVLDLRIHLTIVTLFNTVFTQSPLKDWSHQYFTRIPLFMKALKFKK